MGIRTIAVYSEADASAAYVSEADTAVTIGPAPAAESYLDIGAILRAARSAGAGAVHPGYGFLAENAAFARACAEADLTFIGPPVEVIELMGDKRAARALAARYGPILPGYDGVDTGDGALIDRAAAIGYPLMVKAAFGGGGKGMRLVREAAGLPEALVACRREAALAFGRDDLLLERALIRPRHIEIQIFGDGAGHIIHLGERECTIQRRHQKVIEESPAPSLSPELREAMGTAAVNLARAAEYAGAGTVEFLVEDGLFYFLEMNTRLQVEHPVTEFVTGIDLVEWQIRVAAGESLPWRQEDVRFEGHALEARIYAEDPSGDFRPATGQVLIWRPPAGTESLRIDDGIRTGDTVSPFYDPMLAKIIAHGRTRDEAVRQLESALGATALLGLANNLAFLRQLLRHPAFVDGELHVGFLEEHDVAGSLSSKAVEAALIAASLAQWQDDAGDGPGYWRNNPGEPAPYVLSAHNRPWTVHLIPDPRKPNEFAVRISPGEIVRKVTLVDMALPDVVLAIDDSRLALVLAASGDTCWVQSESGAIRLDRLPLLPEPARAGRTAGSLRASMPGTVVAVLVEPGQAVDEGAPLIKLEAMKMEYTIRAASAGVVEAVHYQAGDRVNEGAALARIIPPDDRRG